jgi:predicted transglutaminase-like cysteine proteinase
MKRDLRDLTPRALILLSTIALFTCLFIVQGRSYEYPRFIHVGTKANMPIGWVQFCTTYISICVTKPVEPRDVVLDDKAWMFLNRINEWANDNIRPMTDMDHYGMIQWWRYPDDGSGACHSYALLKRRMLMQAGWPRSALLMTIVREATGEGHAVLTVKTDKGEYILDNLTDKILLWSETPYHYYKRQSQTDPNTWVSLDDTHDPSAVATSSLR